MNHRRRRHQEKDPTQPPRIPTVRRDNQANAAGDISTEGTTNSLEGTHQLATNGLDEKTLIDASINNEDFIKRWRC